MAVGLLLGSMQPAEAAVGCTRVYGYSVTNQWFPFVDSARWESSAVGGHGLEAWADPATKAWSRPPRSACGTPTRVVFQVGTSLPHDDGTVAALLVAAITNIRAHVPTATQIALMPINGGPAGALCTNAGGRSVWATLIHTQMLGAIQGALGGDVTWAGDYPVASCSMFADGRGHLTTQGASYVGGLVTTTLG
jgi:hypothetical protein